MDSKVKSAFNKVKSDYLKLSNEVLDISTQLNKIKKSNKLGDDVTNQIKKLDNLDLEGFVINMEKEFRSINTLINSFNQTVEK